MVDVLRPHGVGDALLAALIAGAWFGWQEVQRRFSDVPHELDWDYSVVTPVEPEPEYVTRDLSLGRHVVSLTATDEGGASSSSSVEIEVTSCSGNCPPSVRIVTPDDYVAIADFECITATAVASDVEDGALSHGVFTWTTTYFDGSGEDVPAAERPGRIAEQTAAFVEAVVLDRIEWS